MLHSPKPSYRNKNRLPTQKNVIYGLQATVYLFDAIFDIV